MTALYINDINSIAMKSLDKKKYGQMSTGIINAALAQKYCTAAED